MAIIGYQVFIVLRVFHEYFKKVNVAILKRIRIMCVTHTNILRGQYEVDNSAKDNLKN